MRILWVCNQCIPAVAKHLDMKIGNKEGWLNALSEKLLSSNDGSVQLGVCFPAEEEKAEFKGEFEVTAYGYSDDRSHPEVYPSNLENRFEEILNDFKPDVIHIFGTEYPHTLAICKACKEPWKILIGIQGLCSVYARHYFDGLPEGILDSSTLRDSLKNDNLRKQHEKFVTRGEYEEEAIRIAGNVTGRTDWDKKHTALIHPGVQYHFMNETLRSNFYTGKWNYETCEKHSLFASQGDYPIKGLHLLLKGLAQVKKQYPDVELYVAGNKITGEDSLKKKVLIGSYGKYILKLIRENDLQENVVFLGSLSADEMKERYLKSNAFISPSVMENSPNSVGEAMLLSMPVISTDVGGVRNLLADGEEGFIYPALDQEAMVAAICKCFEENGTDEQHRMCDNAAAKARITHDATANYKRLLQIYESISKQEA